MAKKLTTPGADRKPEHEDVNQRRGTQAGSTEKDQKKAATPGAKDHKVTPNGGQMEPRHEERMK